MWYVIRHILLLPVVCVGLVGAGMTGLGLVLLCAAAKVYSEVGDR